MSEESPDKWVIQDRVPVRDCDRGWWVSDAQPLPAPEQMWACHMAGGGAGSKHGDKWPGPVRPGEQIPTLHVMCRLKDLPPLPEEPPLPEIMCKCKDPAAPCETPKDDHPDLLIDAALRLSHWVKNYGHMKQKAWVNDLNLVLDAISKQASDRAKPKEPLRFSLCVPDKPGLWCRNRNGHLWLEITESSLKKCEEGMWCYAGPVPTILPQKKKVVERLWLLKVRDITSSNRVEYNEHWLGHDEQPTESRYWIRTDKTREREIEQ